MLRRSDADQLGLTDARVHAAAMAEAERLKPIANGAYWRNKILARQPAIDAIKPTLAD
jgi:hypothetical protein